MCRVCGSAHDPERLSAREMMFGSREAFDYAMCRACGCLQIAQIPTDLDRHYPSAYYQIAEAPLGAVPDWCSTMLGCAIPVTMPFARFATPAARDAALARRALDYYFPARRPALDAHILDVGCGSGSFLRALGAAGYTDLLGVDPFYSAASDDDSIEVRRAALAALDGVGRWDLVMFHHSLEHVADQAGTLRAAARLLAPDGVLLVRIPVVPSAAWVEYGVDWVQLDAPRHLYLHSEQSLRIAARAAGLTLVDLRHDSTGFQFRGSELYRRDVPLFGAHPNRPSYSSAELRAFDRRAATANALGLGDQVACLFRAA